MTFNITEEEGYQEVPEKPVKPKKAAKKKAKAEPARDYTIRYGTLEANQISDSVLVKNPAYGTPIGNWGSRPVAPSARQRKSEGQFYLDLETSMRKDGILNPVLCNCFEEGTFSRYGSSRLWLAKKNKIKVPCIIADYTGEWSHLEELKTEQDVLAKFKDAPATLQITKDEIWYEGCSVG